jgi:ATP-binding cassette subfamily B protein
MLAIGWETGPAVFLSFIGVSVVASVGPMLFAFGLRPLVDGIYYRNGGSTVEGAVTCLAALLMLLAAPSANRWTMPRIRERSIMVMQRRLLVLSTTAPGLDQFERPDYWDRLQQLKRNFGDLLMGMANTLTAPLILVQLLIAAAVLARLQPMLLVLPVLGVPAAWLNQRAERVRLASEGPAAAPRRAAQHLFTLASSAESAKETRVYGLEDELLSRHRSIAADVGRITEAALIRSSALSTAGWLLFSAGYAGASIVALRAAVAGHLTPGDVALTLTLATSLIAAAGRLSEMAGLLMRAVAVAGHYHWLASQVSAPGGRAASRQRAPVPAVLDRGYELQDVSFGYPGTGRLALAGVTLRLDPGMVVAIVGENGAGKTTLVKLLCRMYTPSEGRILLDGADIQDMDIDDYRRGISAGFQDFVRFELLTRESVGVGDLPRIDDAAAVRGALQQAEAQFTERLANGLDTQLGRSWDGGTDLSGGEWQKLALARALMRRDTFLTVFDEPTAALDPQTEHALFERIAAATRRGAARGRVTLLISHRFSTVRMADLIVVLSQGQVLEQGSHRKLMARRGLYAELYGLQAKAYRI